MRGLFFGSAMANAILRTDKSHPGWMRDVPGYGGNAPMPRYDHTSNLILTMDEVLEEHMDCQGWGDTVLLMSTEGDNE